MSVEPSASDQKLLLQERDRIKSALYAEYGEQIKKMMDDNQMGANAASPCEVRNKHLHDMISNKTPLRQQVASVQDDAIKRLIEEAGESQKRGENVNDRLQMLLAMQESSPNRARQKLMEEQDKRAAEEGAQ